MMCVGRTCRHPTPFGILERGIDQIFARVTWMSTAEVDVSWRLRTSPDVSGNILALVPFFLLCPPCLAG